MNILYFFMILGLLNFSCSSSQEKERKTITDSSSISEVKQNSSVKEIEKADFNSFLSLFEDITPYLGNEDEFVFSTFTGNLYEKKIKGAKPMPDVFKKFINSEIKSFQFLQDHLNENRAYIPIYKIFGPDLHVVILYYSVPEVPRQRVQGDYFLMYTFDKEGKLLNGYPLSYSGTPNLYGYTKRSARLSSLEDIEVFTWHADRDSKKSKEFQNRVTITKDGSFEEDIDKLHFELLPQEWVSATDEEVQTVSALKACDQWAATLTLNVDGMLNYTMTHYTGQEATAYKVTDFSYDPFERKYSMHLEDPNDSGWFPVTLYYDDPENISIRTEGFGPDGGITYLFVKKESVDNGSIPVKKMECGAYD